MTFLFVSSQLCRQLPSDLPLREDPCLKQGSSCMGEINRITRKISMEKMRSSRLIRKQGDPNWRKVKK